MRRSAIVLAALVPSHGAMAQGLAYTDASQVFGPPLYPGYYASYPGGTPVDTRSAYVLATSSSSSVNVPPKFGYISIADLVAAGGQGGTPTNSAALTAMASRLDRFTNRFREGISLAGSINVLPPNPGDRFAVSFGGAGYDGTGAGSVAVSVRISDSAIAYAAVARGPTQTLVKGGVGFSIP